MSREVRRIMLGVAMCALAVVIAPRFAASADVAKSKATPASAKPAAAPAKVEVKPDAAQEAMMAEMAKLATPGPAHERLKAMVGKWKAVTKSWFAPGTEPTVSEGVSENRSIMGGRFLESEFKGNFMGQPFEGFGITGYDNKKAAYNMFWVDNMGTQMLTGFGTMDAAGKELTVKSTADGPDGKPMDFRMVTKIIDDNSHVFSMFGKMGDKEQLMMEITYTRM